MSLSIEDPLLVQTASSQGATLRVLFQRSGDRWTHEVQLQSGAELIRLCAAREGGEQDRWPPSAVIQEVLPQSTEAGWSVAGLGMAGKSHWSLVVAPLVDTVGVEFDVACRVKELPDWLGATYELAGAMGIESTQRGCRWPAGAGWVQFEPQAETELQFSVDRKRITVRPAKLAGGQPETIRWKYRISWE